MTVLDLVGGIDRRQRRLDTEQDQVRSQIAQLLQQDWFDAVDQAQALLETTTARLAELNTVLLRDAHQLSALLQEIQDLAAEHPDAAATVEAAQRVIDQVDRIALCGEARQHAWSEHYRYVHAYVRDVVRLDPDRALTQGLRDQLAAWSTRTP